MREFRFLVCAKSGAKGMCFTQSEQVQLVKFGPANIVRLVHNIIGHGNLIGDARGYAVCAAVIYMMDNARTGMAA